MAMASSLKCSSLLDTMQVVPQLLQCVSSHCGVKALRLLCQEARAFSVKAVSGYTATLSSRPSETEPLLQVAAFLNNTRLQRLRVTVNALADKPSYFVSTHDLSSQTTQLQEFVSLMGPSLFTVTSLELTVEFTRCGCTSSGSTTSGCSLCSSSLRVVPSHTLESAVATAAATGLAPLLSTACPNLTHLSVGGGLGGRALTVLCSNSHKITSLEIMDRFFDYKLLLGESGLGFENENFPHITHLKMPFAVIRDEHVMRTCSLVLFPFLTHLQVGEGWFDLPVDWLLLPHLLTDLHCQQPPATQLQFPDQVHLGRMQNIHVHGGDPVVHIKTLNFLFRAAPCLQLLCMVEGRGNHITIEDNCELALADEVQCLHQRLLSGCRLAGVTVQCSGSLVALAKTSRESSFPLEQLLTLMPSLPSFLECVVLYHSQYGGRLSTLSAMARILPDLQVLSLEGTQHCEQRNWQDGAEVHEKTVFANLQRLNLRDGGWLTASECLRLVSRMPKLTALLHSSKLLHQGCGRFQGKLQAMQRVKVSPGQKGTRDGGRNGFGNGGCGSGSADLSVWTLQDKDTCSATWEKLLTIAGLLPVESAAMVTNSPGAAP